MATVAISSTVSEVQPGEYKAVVSLVDAAGTPVSMSEAPVSVPSPAQPAPTQTAPVVTVS